jgi:hypothetical protein
VDDVLLMTRASPSEWREISDILKYLCGVSSMCINNSKTLSTMGVWRRQNLYHLKKSFHFHLSS